MIPTVSPGGAYVVMNSKTEAGYPEKPQSDGQKFRNKIYLWIFGAAIIGFILVVLLSIIIQAVKVK